MAQTVPMTLDWPACRRPRRVDDDWQRLFSSSTLAGWGRRRSPAGVDDVGRQANVGIRSGAPVRLQLLRHVFCAKVRWRACRSIPVAAGLVRRLCILLKSKIRLTKDGKSGIAVQAARTIFSCCSLRSPCPTSRSISDVLGTDNCRDSDYAFMVIEPTPIHLVAAFCCGA